MNNLKEKVETPDTNTDTEKPNNQNQTDTSKPSTDDKVADTNATNGKSQVKTGDSTSLTRWFVMLTLAAVGMIAGLFIKRKRDNC